MSLYQRKLLSDMSAIGPAAVLPSDLDGLEPATLADLSAGVDPCPPEYAGQGFFPVADPPAPPAPDSALAFEELFTAPERISIRAAAASSGQLTDWLDLLSKADQVHFDDPKTIAGVEALVAGGLITADRAAQVLAGIPPA
jgi:hypothetical protein